MNLSVPVVCLVTSLVLAGCGMGHQSGVAAFNELCQKNEDKELCNCASDYLGRTLNDKELEVLGILIPNIEKGESADGPRLAGEAGLALEEFGEISQKVSIQMRAAEHSCMQK